jgi:hypothetical protein
MHRTKALEPIDCRLGRRSGRRYDAGIGPHEGEHTRSASFDPVAMLVHEAMVPPAEQA